MTEHSLEDTVACGETLCPQEGGGENSRTPTRQHEPHLASQSLVVLSVLHLHLALGDPLGHLLQTEALSEPAARLLQEELQRTTATSRCAYLSVTVDQDGHHVVSCSPRRLGLPQQVGGRAVDDAGISGPHL